MVRFNVRSAWLATIAVALAGAFAGCSGGAPASPRADTPEPSPTSVQRTRVSLILGSRAIVADLEVTVLSSSSRPPPVAGEHPREISRWMDAAVRVKNPTDAALWPPDFTVRCPTGESANYLDYGDEAGFGLRLIPPRSTQEASVRLAIPEGCDSPMLEVTATDPLVRLVGRAPLWALE